MKGSRPPGGAPLDGELQAPGCGHRTSPDVEHLLIRLNFGGYHSKFACKEAAMLVRLNFVPMVARPA